VILSRHAGGSANRDLRSGVELVAPTCQKSPLPVGVHQLQREAVGGSGLLLAPEPAQELGPGGVEVVVALELERLERREPGLDVACLGDRHRSVQLDHRRAGEGVQLAVQGGDLRPVRRILEMEGGDRGLE
jgi:hypothetical protein